MDYLSHEERASRRRQLACDVSNGLSPDEAAEKHGVSRAWAVACCAEFGTLPKYHKSSVVEVVASLMRAGPGDTLASIARTVSLSRERVRQILQQCQRYEIVSQEWPFHEHSPCPQEVGASRR